jgi:hypothetical protein
MVSPHALRYSPIQNHLTCFGRCLAVYYPKRESVAAIVQENLSSDFFPFRLSPSSSSSTNEKTALMARHRFTYSSLLAFSLFFHWRLHYSSAIQTNLSLGGGGGG